MREIKYLEREVQLGQSPLYRTLIAYSVYALQLYQLVITPLQLHQRMVIALFYDLAVLKDCDYHRIRTPGQTEKLGKLEYLAHRR